MKARLSFVRISLAVVWIVSGTFFVGLGLVGVATNHRAAMQQNAGTSLPAGLRG
jgi:hypothetical protein